VAESHYDQALVLAGIVTAGLYVSGDVGRGLEEGPKVVIHPGSGDSQNDYVAKGFGIRGVRHGRCTRMPMMMAARTPNTIGNASLRGSITHTSVNRS
jgi:hypothetical protein